MKCEINNDINGRNRQSPVIAELQTIKNKPAVVLHYLEVNTMFPNKTSWKKSN